ncbi:MAG TPA: acyl-CoA thioesterase domain-containing protein [Pseudomonadales bacterium]
MSLLQRLLGRLKLAEAGRDAYIGGAGEGGIGGESRLFGGLVAAQAAMAAQHTVEGFPLHSLHAYFLRPGRARSDIEYGVTRSKQGRNFQVREVAAWQNGERIFQLQASFQRPVAGVEHEDPMPAVAAPESLPNRDQLRGRSNWREMPVDVRMATPMTAGHPLPAVQHVWLKANGAVPEDPAVHTALIVYASDRSLLDTAWRPHADRGRLAGASLDHAMWFHRVPRFDDWLLYTMASPAAAGGRGLAIGALYDQSGRRLVTVAQEGVLRSAG